MSEKKLRGRRDDEGGRWPGGDDRLRALLREGDPAADGHEPSRDERAALRRRLLAEVRERPRAWRWLPAAAAAAALAGAALLVPRLLDERPLDRRDPGPRSPMAESAPAEPAGETDDRAPEALAPDPPGRLSTASGTPTRPGDLPVTRDLPRPGRLAAAGARSETGDSAARAGVAGAAGTPVAGATETGSEAAAGPTGRGASAVAGTAPAPERRRQLQFATTRGTRIIWVLDADLAL